MHTPSYLCNTPPKVDKIFPLLQTILCTIITKLYIVVNSMRFVNKNLAKRKN